MDLRRSAPIVDQVRAAVAGFRRFADAAGVPARRREQVARVIAPARRRR